MFAQIIKLIITIKINKFNYQFHSDEKITFIYYLKKKKKLTCICASKTTNTTAKINKI